MESLGYIHLALAYQASTDSDLIGVQEHSNLFEPLNRQKLSSKTWLYLLPLAVTLSLLGIATQALAELQPGTKSAEVTALQQRLQQLGYYQGRITGNFGPYTTEVVTKFQKDKGLNADGIVGAQTQAALRQQQRQTRSTRLSTRTRSQASQRPAVAAPLSNRSRSNSTVRSNPRNATQVSDRNSRTQKPQTRVVRTQSNNVVASPARRSRAQQPQPSAGATTTPRFVTLGDRGSAVRSIQQRLKLAGFYNGAVDGVFSPATETALREFQQAKRLTVDGIVGPRTLAALQGVRRNSPTQSPKPVANGGSLQRGSRGEAVAALQRRLKQLGYYNGEITNEFNAETQEAVLQFQQERNLTADGVAGATTLSALANAVNRDGVQALQKRLQDQGFYQGPINGVLNQQTQAAITAAQEAYGISGDDIRRGNF